MPDDRLASLDIFRGVTIAAMILVNNPGSSPVYTQLDHAVWHGWTFTDTIFPFFLWISGVAMAISTSRRIARGATSGVLLRHLFSRSVSIFALGFFMGPFPNYNFATIRISGVLQRIAVCCLVAGVASLFSGKRGLWLWIVGLNAAYWALMMLYPVPGCGAGSLTMECNFARYVDSLVLSGHMWRVTKVWDPEGIVSTLPAITSCLFGILTGRFFLETSDVVKRLRGLIVNGIALTAAGFVLSLGMPINKNLWTTPYAVLMAGLASLCLAAWLWIADMRGWKAPFQAFTIFGSNSILMFLLSALVAKYAARTHAGPWFYRNVCLAVASQINASLLYALANVALLFLMAWFLWQRRWFVKF